MRGLLRPIAFRILRWLHLDGLYVLWRAGPLREDGWFRSYRERESVDASGLPIPWIAYPAIAYLSGHVQPAMAVFEYGCGNGTLWWAARVREVIAVEHDPAWAERVAGRAPGHVTILDVPLEYGGEYARTAASYPGRFDIVVIDGRDRLRCAEHALVALKPDGVIVWDNTDRVGYAPGISFLEARGFRRLDFEGLAPVENLRAKTTIFYRSQNCLGI